ncbi:MAG: hypothetical protein O7G28_05415 [Deltaproteobacteria bacterium]|nr:hypothetical protein [Deltaproteobacteria bacterium]
MNRRESNQHLNHQVDFIRRHPNHQNIKIKGVSSNVMSSFTDAARPWTPENKQLQITPGGVWLIADTSS